MRISIILTLAASVGLVVGCSNEDSVEPTSQAPATSAAAEDSSPAAAPRDATTIVDELRAAGLPISDTLLITEDNDSNNLIGRPNQYTSKVVFADERTGVPIDRASPGVDAGGSVEMFAEDEQAKARADYISGLQAELGPIAGVEYQYLVGPALVRVSGELTPSVAAEYQAAVAAMG